MSASREKKNRQEVAASGVADPKTARHAQELAKERRSNRLYAIIAIAFVVVAIGLVVWNSNIIQRGTTAVTVEGESYSAAEVSYYYHNAYNSIVNSKYASLYGINKNTALSQQNLNDTAKMMLGVSEDMTWDAYFRDAAKKSLIQLTMLKKGAAEKGMTFNDDMQKEVDSTVETFSTYAKKAGYSTSAYLKLMYGNNMTMSTFKSILKDTLLASHYQQDYIDSLTYTDEEVETYYNEHKNNFDVADYEYIYFKGTADSTKDADGNTVEPTDEENAAAKEAAEKLTQSRLKGFAAMNKEMKAALEFLNMPGIRFALKHTRGPLSSHGQDTVEFLISTNPGEEPKPLAKIASGGELSRIMLAFKSALADRDALPTVIYDEIDTGVSGLAAGRIGQLLHQTARGHQVLCITHTPQVAAFADNQLLIQKNVRKDRTFTEIHTLDMDGRVEVLARMISGDKVSELSLASARELIEKSK